MQICTPRNNYIVYFFMAIENTTLELLISLKEVKDEVGEINFKRNQVTFESYFTKMTNESNTKKIISTWTQNYIE